MKNEFTKFIDHLREHKESVDHFGLTVESLLDRVILPERDKPIFVARFQDKLGLEPARAHRHEPDPGKKPPIGQRLSKTWLRSAFVRCWKLWWGKDGP